MRLLAILIVSVSLTACMHQPIKIAEYPLPDNELLVPPKTLILLPDNVDLTDVSKTIIQNYTTYNVIATRLELLQKWVIRMREESINVNDRTTNSKEEIR